MGTRRILLLSDFHVGSIWGLWPKKFTTIDPRSGDRLKFQINNTQTQLLKHWKTMLEYLTRHPPDCIIFNGDLCDGDQWRSMGKSVVTTNLRIQADAAVDLISTLPDAPLYFTQGTAYHSMEDRPLEEWIAEHCSGEFGDDLLIDECGIRLHVGHPIPVSNTSWQYRTTPLARDLLLLALNDAEDRYGQVHVAVRSHAHYFCEASFRSQLGIITPCWQTRTPYAVKRDIVTPPDIGWVMLHIHSPSCIAVDRSGITHIARPSRVVGREA